MTDQPDGETPETCQYGECELNTEGALDFYFGVRWYCSEHFHEMKTAWQQTADMAVLKNPND